MYEYSVFSNFAEFWALRPIVVFLLTGNHNNDRDFHPNLPEGEGWSTVLWLRSSAMTL